MKFNFKVKIFIFLLILVFGFSDFVSILPLNFQKNKLAENFKIKKAVASVAYQTPGVIAYSASGGVSISPAYPAAIAANDLLVLVIGMKPSIANGGSVTTPGGWTPIVSLTGAGGYGTTLGADTGNTNIFTFYKIAAGGETGTLAVTVAQNGVSWAQMYRFNNALGNWDVAGTTGSDITGGASVSVAFGTDPGVMAGDYVLGAMTIPTDVTTPAQFSAEALTQTGITFGAVTEISEPDRTTGNDIGGVTYRALVSSGVSAGNPIFTATAGGTTTNVRGPGAFIRIREIVFGPDATGFTNDTEGVLSDGGRSSHQITVTSAGANFGAGPSNGTTNAVKIGTYIVPNGNVISWNATTIVFTIPAAATVYGGTGADGLIIRTGGNDDTTPLDFYIYPNITSTSANGGQIGSMITISGDHFGASAGTLTINTKTASVGTWGETSLANVKIPGQEGAANINGKIQIMRADIKTSNQYPADPSNFTILAPSVSGSNPSSATTGQTLTIQFSGLGIDTDTGTAPILKLTKGQPANCSASATCIIGTSYAKVTDYQAVSAIFDLSGAATGYWKLVIVNMDEQSGSFGNESTTGFYISALAPIVNIITPTFGLSPGTVNILSIDGENFQSSATVLLRKSGEADIAPSTPFAYSSPTQLINGVFNLDGKAFGFWDIVVTNPDSQAGTKGNGFEIRSAKPSDPDPAKLYQFKTSGDIAEPPTENIAVRNGINSTTVYFRMNIVGGLAGPANPYTPQVEVKQAGVAFDGLPGSIIDGTDVVYDGVTPALGWVSVPGLLDNTLYHWQARVKNSAGTSAWVSFGANPESEHDFYIDIAPPTIDYANCATAAPIVSITDLSAIIQWNTFDTASGAQSNFPGSGTWAKVQVDYKISGDPWTTTLLSAWENSLPHRVTLLGLSPAANYIFRMRSQDYLGNEAISPDCTFSTTSSRPIKTVEFFITQKTGQNNGEQITEPFSVRIPEGRSAPETDISVKSAFIEITGISSIGSQVINIGLLRGNQVTPPAGDNYDIDSSDSTTPFTILFDALNPQGAGQENMSNITSGNNDPYDYTLFLKGNGVTVSVFSAKLIITYSYAQ